MISKEPLRIPPVVGCYSKRVYVPNDANSRGCIHERFPPRRTFSGSIPVRKNLLTNAAVESVLSSPSRRSHHKYANAMQATKDLAQKRNPEHLRKQVAKIPAGAKNAVSWVRGQKLAFSANCPTRGLTEVPLIRPKLAELKLLSGSANWG